MPCVMSCQMPQRHLVPRNDQTCGCTWMLYVGHVGHLLDPGDVLVAVETAAHMCNVSIAGVTLCHAWICRHVLAECWCVVVVSAFTECVDNVYVVCVYMYMCIPRCRC